MTTNPLTELHCCGLYPDEHCDQCGYCPGWHAVDCDNGAVTQLLVAMYSDKDIGLTIS
jgi:hypothetical protein